METEILQQARELAEKIDNGTLSKEQVAAILSKVPELASVLVKIAKEDAKQHTEISKAELVSFDKLTKLMEIVWKDPNFFGLLYTDGSIMGEFENRIGNNMNFSGADEKGFGTQLPNDRINKLGFTFEGVVKYPHTVIKKSPNDIIDDTLEEQFRFYSK